MQTTAVIVRQSMDMCWHRLSLGCCLQIPTVSRFVERLEDNVKLPTYSRATHMPLFADIERWACTADTRFLGGLELQASYRGTIVNKVS
jgi:hypothetical protein